MKKNLNVISIILSVIVIIVFFTLEFLLGVECPVNKTMEVENLSEIMEEIDIERLFRDENGKEIPMGTRIYGYFDKIGLTRQEVDAVVKDKSFKKIIGNYLGSMFVNSVTGTKVIYPTQSELVNFIHNNYERFKNVTDFPKNYDQAEISKIVNNNYNNVKYELNELAKEIKWDKIPSIDIVKELMTTKTILLIGGLLLCIVLLMIFRKSYYKWLKWVSFPTMLSGAILLIISLVGNRLVNLFVDFGRYDFILDLILNDMLKNMCIFGVLEAVLGVIALFMYHAIKSALKSKEKAKNVKELESEEANL